MAKNLEVTEHWRTLRAVALADLVNGQKVDIKAIHGRTEGGLGDWIAEAVVGNGERCRLILRPYAWRIRMIQTCLRDDPEALLGWHKVGRWGEIPILLPDGQHRPVI